MEISDSVADVYLGVIEKACDVVGGELRCRLLIKYLVILLRCYSNYCCYLAVNIRIKIMLQRVALY